MRACEPIPVLEVRTNYKYYKTYHTNNTKSKSKFPHCKAKQSPVC